MDDTRQHWRLCSICKTPIGFDTRFWACSVSTCNRKRTRLTFCSVRCWDAHVPTLRHRDAWAVEETAPSRAAWEAERAEEQREAAAPASRPAAPRPTEGARRIVAPAGERIDRGDGDLADDFPVDTLIVASKLKAYVKARGGMRTSDGVLPLLSDLVRAAADEAIRRARADERQTVLDRDVPEGWRPE